MGAVVAFVWILVMFTQVLVTLSSVVVLVLVVHLFSSLFLIV